MEIHDVNLDPSYRYCKFSRSKFEGTTCVVLLNLTYILTEANHVTDIGCCGAHVSSVYHRL